MHELAPIMLFLHSLKFLLVLRSMMHGHGHGDGDTAIFEKQGHDMAWTWQLNNWEMLTSALRTLVKNPVKKSFYGKRKKKLMF